MNSTQLDPVVAGKLQQFGRRRRRLIWVRGICAGVVSFLVVISAIAFADWTWVLADKVRWSLSGLAYAAVLISVWLSCLRRMIYKPAMRELATRMEVAEPELRENLLSAVELATDNPALINDSPIFRSLLQGHVARRMTTLRVSSLLPWRLLGGWLAAALLLVATGAFLLSLSNAPFRRLATRAVLPGANVARVSRTQVKILQPTPHSLTLAEDETVAVVVEISGGNVDEVTLELQSPSQGLSKQTMRPREAAIFVSNLQVAGEPIEYRILAGDAVTKRYLIDSRPRPRVLAFHKTFHFPEYSGLEEETVTEKQGDLTVLEGTEVDLVLELDQDVVAAELRLQRESSEEIESIVLAAVGERRFRVTLPIDSPAVYKVHLVSQETGFENKFSPKYEVRPLPDLIPRVGFVDQQETTLLLPPNDILALSGMAEDDLPLVRLDQQFAVYGREWQTVELSTESSRRITTDWQWDLLSLNLESGDQILTRLVATDRKGNVGESVPLRIVVSAQAFDPNRHASTLLKSQFYETLADFADRFAEHKAKAKELLDRLRDATRPADAAVADLASLREVASKQHAEAGKLLDRTREILSQMPAGPDAYELDLVGRVIGRLRHEHANTPTRLLEALKREDIDPKGIEKTYASLQQVFDRSADDAKRLAELYRDLMAHNVLAAIAFDLDALLCQQRLTVKGATQTWERLTRQETVVQNQFRILEQLIQDQRPRLPVSTHRWLAQYLDWIQTWRQRLEQAMESEDKLALLRQTGASLLRELEGRQRVDVTEGRLPGSIVNARNDFDNRSGTLFAPLNEMGGRANETYGRLVELKKSQDSAESLRIQKSIESLRIELQVYQVAARGQLQVRRSLTQARRDADAQYAVDAGLTQRAVAGLYRVHQKDPLAEPLLQHALAEIAPAYRVLEGGHEVAQVRDALDSLTAGERWSSQEITARLDHPRQWDALANGIQLSARRLGEAGVARDLTGRIDALRRSPSANEAARKITARRSQRDAMVGAGYELSELQAELKLVIEDLDSVLAEARAVIAKYVLTIPEMAQEAADDVRALQEQTIDAADQAENQQPPETPPLDQLQNEQDRINQQIEELINALVEDANRLDLLNEDELEHARDADASIAMIQETAAAMNEALDEAAETSDPEDQASELAQTAETQDKAADALQKVADHFGRLEAGEDVTETRAAIRPQPASDGQQDEGNPIPSGEEGPLDQQYAAAEDLAQMASQSPQQLMQELEAELQQNSAMQESLSRISKDTLQQAKNALEDAAEQDDQMQRQIERSDPEFQAKKRELIDDLKRLTKEAADVANTLVAQANSAANQGKVPQSQKQLAATQQQLREAQANASQLNDNTLLAEISEAAVDIDEKIRDSAEKLTDAKEETAEAAKKEIHADDKARAAAQKALEKSRQNFQNQRIKSTRDAAKRAADAQRRATQAAQQAENALRNAERQTKQAQTNADKDPKNQGLINALNQAKARQTAAKEKVDVAKEAVGAANEVSREAAEAAKSMAERKLPPLAAPNPAAELANEYSAEAAGIVEDLAEKANQLAESMNWADQLQPPAAPLAAAGERQTEIQRDVQQAGQDVARAARHERRLKNDDPIESMENAAKGIEQVAANEIEQSLEQLAGAEEAAKEAVTDTATAAGDTPDGDMPDEGPAPQHGDQNATAAREAVEASEEAIAAQADQLGQILEAAEQAAQAAETSAPADENPGDGQGEPGANPAGQDPAGQNQPQGAGQATPATPAELARGELLARTLDELDQRLAAEGSQTPAADSRLLSLAQAARAQNAVMAAARTPQPSPANALDSLGQPATNGELGRGFAVKSINRDDGREWGMLRENAAEDTVKGTREAVAAEYRKSVEAYFRVLAERARQKQ